MLRVGKLWLSRIGQNFLSITELLFIAIIYYSKSLRSCHLSGFVRISVSFLRELLEAVFGASLFLRAAQINFREFLPVSEREKKYGERFEGNFNACDSVCRLWSDRLRKAGRACAYLSSLGIFNCLIAGESPFGVSFSCSDRFPIFSLARFLRNMFPPPVYLAHQS